MQVYLYTKRIITFVQIIYWQQHRQKLKHFGSLMECAEERIADLMRAYDDYISSCAYIRMPECYEFLAKMPAPRFYVSDIRAALVVSAMIDKRTKSYKNMRPLKREMFQEICRRVVKMRKKSPGMTVLECCKQVVLQPAPKFYISANTAKCIVCKNREEWKRKKLQRLRLLPF